MTQILVVEDELAIAESIAYALGKAGHDVAIASSLTEARAQLGETQSIEAEASPPFGLIVLDLMLPDGSGFDWIAELAAERGSGMAVLVLSSRDGENDRIRALEMGADDYVTKPFSPREVVARVSAILRRMEKGQAVETSESASGELTLNRESRRVSVQGNLVELTRVEFDLLALLLSDPGYVFSRATIIDQVWGPGFALSDRTIDSHVKALRKKLNEWDGAGNCVETVRGIGYRAREGSNAS